MKIAQVVSLNESVPPKSRGGLEFLVSWLTEELVNRGHEVTLFAPATSQTNAKLSPLVTLPMSETAKKNWEKTFFSTWNSVIAAMRASEFDLIHSHNGNSAFTAPFVDIPLIETLHGAYDDDLREIYFSNTDQHALAKPALQELEKINYVAVSKRQEELFAQCEPYYFKKHSTIHNGIPVKKFSFNPKPKDYLLYIGYMTPDKGADIAVQVAKQAGMKLILAGEKIGTEAFFKEKIEPYLNSEIQYVGPVEFKKKNDLYGNAKALLAPLRWEEPFGLTIVEAQACGTPVVAFKKGAAAEIIKHGKTGFVINTEQEMVESLQKIEKIDRAECRKWVEENFSVEKMVDKYEELYKKLLKK